MQKRECVLLTWHVDVDRSVTLNELLVTTVHRHDGEGSEQDATELREGEVWARHAAAHLARIRCAIPAAVRAVVTVEVFSHAFGLRQDLVAVIFGRLVNRVLAWVEARSEKDPSNGRTDTNRT